MADFQKIFEELKEDVINLAKLTFKNFKEDAESDMNAFLNASKEKLERWTLLLTQNKIDKDDFAFLAKGLKDLATLELLKEKAEVKIRIDEFKNSLVNLITDTVFKFV